MSDPDSTTDGIERRGVLAALATGIGGAGLARGALGRLDAPDGTGFVAEQGDRCVPITPLSGDRTVEAFYDYRTPFTSPSGARYASYGTTDLQRPETSVCFLYDGPDGLSLVVVHDKLNDGTAGGAVTFDLTFAHPDRGSWVVGDDDYDASTNYDSFDRTADGWSVDWTWAEGRSDGGAYRPLGESFAVTIDPAFNEAAELYGDHYEGQITDWQVLSGDRDSPERVSLALDEPLTIRSGTCGATTTTSTPTATTERETTTGTDGDGTTTDEETATEEGAEAESSDPVSADVTVVPGGVNPRSRGRLPVVVHSTEAFDATALAPGSVAFGPAGATPVHAVRTDADGDGRADLKLHFRTTETGIGSDTDRVRLLGETQRGRRVEGSAEIRVVGEREDGDDENGEEDDENGGDDDENEGGEDEDVGENREDDDAEEPDDEEDEGVDDGEREAADDEREVREDDDEERDGESDEQADSEDEDDGWPRGDDGADERPGRGNEREHGNGRGDGDGEGRGRGNDRNRGAGRGTGRGKGNGRGRGTGRGENWGEGRDD